MKKYRVIVVQNKKEFIYSAGSRDFLRKSFHAILEKHWKNGNFSIRILGVMK